MAKTQSINHKSVGAAFRKRRLALGVNLKWMAGELGVCKSEMSMLENGLRPWSPERIERVRIALK